MVELITYIMDIKIESLVKIGTLFDTTTFLLGFYIQNTLNGKLGYLL